MFLLSFVISDKKSSLSLSFKCFVLTFVMDPVLPTLEICADNLCLIFAINVDGLQSCKIEKKQTQSSHNPIILKETSHLFTILNRGCDWMKLVKFTFTAIYWDMEILGKQYCNVSSACQKSEVVLQGAKNIKSWTLFLSVLSLDLGCVCTKRVQVWLNLTIFLIHPKIRELVLLTMTESAYV